MDNINVDHEETGGDDASWNNSAQNGDWWRGLASAVMRGIS
jgi:hypothetical protein